ncbi:unnamed protein product, partial [Rotaria sordida]
MVTEDHINDEDFKMDSNQMIVDDNKDNINWTDKNLLHHIGDIFELCINQCNLKLLSTLLFMILRHFNFTWRDIDNF